MRDLDLTTLRLFLAVCEHGNIARAAELENIAPSAISKRIAQLEDTLGLPVLVRARRGVAPTAAGQALLERARTMLFEASRIESEMSAFSGGIRGQVRLLATPSAIAESLLDDVAAFMRVAANRDIKVDIEERFTRDVVRALREGSNAIGICWDSTDMKGLQQRAYRQDNLSLAVHADHPLAQRKRLRFDQTLDFDHVGLPSSSAVQLTLQRAAALAGRTVNYRVIVSNFDAAFRVVAANLGISVIPSQVSSLYVASGQVKVVPLTDHWASRRFAICFRETALLQEPSLRIVEHLAQRAASGAEAP